MLKNVPRLADRDADHISKKLAAPLISLLSSPPETQFVALRNIELIAQRYPTLFANDARLFFVRFKDASYIKSQKLAILQRLATKSNAAQILAELEQYAADIDFELVRRSVRAIGHIAVRLPSMASSCVSALSRLTLSRGDLVGEEAAVALQSIVRKYPRRFEGAFVALCESLSDLTDPRAKAAFVWLLGEYAQHIDDGEARLEQCVDSFTSEEHSVQLQMLTATVKMFLKRPTETKVLVQRVLRLATEASADPDLRDRGFVYWRLLSTDPSAARKVVLAERPKLCTDGDIDALSEEYLSALLLNVSSLSSVYHRKPNEFVVGANDVRFHKFDDSEISDSDHSTSTCECSEDCNRHKEYLDSDSDTDTDYDSDAKPKKSETVEAKEENKNVPDLLSQLFDAPAQPPIATTDFALAFVSKKSDGLTMRVAFSRRGGEALMTAQCTNNGRDAIGRVDVKFNKNYLGIAPTQTLPLNGDLVPGATQTLSVSLALSMDPIVGESFNSSVQIQMAARSIRRTFDGHSVAEVHMFAQCVPAEIFFDAEGAVLSQKDFLTAWKNIGAVTETKQLFDSARSIENLKNVLEDNRFVMAAKREIHGRGHSLYFVTRLKSDSVLIELSVANNAKCRLVVRSRNAWFGRVVCDTAVSLLKSQAL